MDQASSTSATEAMESSRAGPSSIGERRPNSGYFARRAGAEAPLLGIEDDLDVRAAVERAAIFGRVRRDRVRGSVAHRLEADLGDAEVGDQVLLHRLRPALGEGAIGGLQSTRVGVSLDP